MSRLLSAAGSECFSSDTHSGPVFYGVVSALWRRKWLITALVGIALTFGIIVGLVMPQRYTAEAYIRGVAAASDAVAKDEANGNAELISLDMGRMMETQSLLLRSQQLARRVVERIGLERVRREVAGGSFYPELAEFPRQQEDLVATRLLRRLSVTADPRAYLITVRFAASDPELAADITNGFIAEILRSIRLQILSQQRSSAQASLTEKLAQFGDKFPRVVEAKLRLQNIDSLLAKWQSETHDEILLAAGENVARAISLPSRRLRLVVALHLLAGVAIGIGVALWLERDTWWRASSQYRVRTFEWLDSDSVSRAAKILVAARLAKRQTKILAARVEDGPDSSQ